MKGFLRNPEIKRTIGLLLIISVIITAIGFAVGKTYGYFCIVICLFFGAAFMASTSKRYRRLAQMSAEIDKILHGEERMLISNFGEGELAILSDEIRKLTLRLMEQADALNKDKRYLADSIADISHQIRTPLTSINILVTLLLEPGVDEMSRRQQLSELRQLLMRIDWLIDSLLKISRLDTGTVVMKKEPVRVSELVTRVQELLEIPIELRGQQLFVDVDDEICYEGDISWSEEALGNIVKNCMEHTPEGGRITVEASQTTLFTEIVISDTGSGIADEDIDHIFERFYKGRNSAEQSVGIGLALARMIIAGQNGTVRVKNLEGGGASFIIRFYAGVI